MGLLSNNINTIPNDQNYKEGEEEPNSVPFVVCACEGDEECDYLSIFESSHRLVKVNDYYKNDQEKKGHSHPQKRIEALIEFLGEESLNLDIKGFSNKIDKAFLVVDRDAQSFKENQYNRIHEHPACLRNHDSVFLHIAPNVLHRTLEPPTSTYLI